MFETELVLSAISGAKLMDLEFMPQEFVVRGLLPKGLSILGGAPKIGKSWLMLELALRVAKGEPMWGMETTQGTVLYYCLEDTLKRIQQRLYCITENGPDNLLFETATGTLATNLEEELLLYISKYPDMSLIIIDTFQMVRGNKGDPSYGSDYDDIQKLKRISDSQNVAILLVHHLRKMGDRDPVNKLSGTTGISGADMSLIIIDTFQMVRGNKGDPSYGSDYDDIQKLKRISDSQNVAILLVHHLRKMGDRDPVNKLSGTTGISGAIDCVYILDKSARLEDVATLTCTGRDIQQRELELRFDPTNCVWNLISDNAEDETKKLPPEMIAFVDFMKHIRFYEGSNTLLAERFYAASGFSMTAKVLKQKLNRWRHPLSDLGVTFSSREVHSGKIVTVQYTPPVSHASQVSQKQAS